MARVLVMTENEHQELHYILFASYRALRIKSNLQRNEHRRRQYADLFARALFWSEKIEGLKE